MMNIGKEPLIENSCANVLTALCLFSGLEARKVVLADNGCAVSLDARVFDFGQERHGVLVTDPVDVRPARGLIRLPVNVRSVGITVAADVPGGAAVVLETRTGSQGLDLSADWSPWQRHGALDVVVTDLMGPYVQARITLTASSPDALPAVRQMALTPDLGHNSPPKATVKVKEAQLETLVRSPITFGYERPDHPRLVKFREENNLDEVVAGAASDFEALVKLMDWTGSCHKASGSSRYRWDDGTYAWDIDKVFSREDGQPRIHGHCMSYAEVMVTAATAMGYVSARHYAVRGFRDMTHEVVEIWVPSLRKWVYFDPSLTQTYTDKSTGLLLDMVDIHDRVASLFIPEDKDMHWWSDRGNPETRERVRAVGGMNERIVCRVGPWHYGEPADPDYDWGWLHGYLAEGFLQMTPRNDFHSHPDKASQHFEQPPGYDGYPFWVDAKTPPTEGGHNWFTRRRDFYWSLDQASLVLTQSTDGAALLVELGQTMPFFKEYRVNDNGQTFAISDAVYTWKLNAGVNRLDVVPVDEFGKIGQGSIVVVERL